MSRFVIAAWTTSPSWNAELEFDTGVNYSAPQMALSYSSHLSVASECRHSVLWIQKQSGGIEVLPNIGRFRELERKTGRKNILSVLRWPCVLLWDTCRLAACPALNWHLISSACVRAPREYQEWQAVCLGLHMPHLFISPLFLLPFSISAPQPFFTFSLSPHTHTHTHTRLPLVFFLTALWQFPSLVLKRFEIAFGPEALAISN